MRPPPITLVIDASILLAAILGRSADVVRSISRRAALTTTDRAIEEARRRIELGVRRPDLLPVLDEIVGELTVESVASLSDRLPAAEQVLRNAPAARNGSISDAHLLALAWSVDGDIWTNDRDFAGTGVATWSTSNLLRGLASAGDA